MPQDQRLIVASSESGAALESGFYIGRITSVLDLQYMGRLEVAIVGPGVPSNEDSKAELLVVHYVSPFFGNSSLKFEGANLGNYEDVQKSYGFWMVPPDIGTQVLVLKAKGVSHGWWIGCIPEQFQNFMVPGIAASTDVIMSNEQRLKYGTTYVPVAEFSKTTSGKTNLLPNKQLKPVHPFADRLLAQGLLLDNIRGVTSSSARREKDIPVSSSSARRESYVPNSVFGISTPGPLYRSGKKGFIGNKNETVAVPITRLGGTQFVMDDGDIDGQNELVRLRTRTGHQILLHNSSDLIYIANAAGTAWIEMTGNGKIDIYAADSVSIHSEADFNFRADRDINIEAGRNINIKSISNIHLESKKNFSILASGDGKISIGGEFDQFVQNNYNLTASKDMNILSGDQIYVSAENGIDILSEGDIKQSTGGTFHFGADKNFYASAKQIHLNGPAAKAAFSARIADVAQPLTVFSLPNRSTDAGWSNGNYYSTESIVSIMQRVPTHEPWSEHENINVDRFNIAKTDSNAATSQAALQGDYRPAHLPPKTAPSSQVPPDWTNDKDFINKVKEISKKYEFNPIDLLTCMSFETAGSFLPSQTTKNSSAVGLIQFTKETAIRLGTTIEKLTAMTRATQCEFVDKYFAEKDKSNRLNKVKTIRNLNLGDVYMAIFAPAFIDNLNSDVMYKLLGTKDKVDDRTKSSDRNYRANAISLDKENKGYITRQDAVNAVTTHLDKVQRKLRSSNIQL